MDWWVFKSVGRWKGVVTPILACVGALALAVPVDSVVGGMPACPLWMGGYRAGHGVDGQRERASWTAGHSWCLVFGFVNSFLSGMQHLC